MVIVFFFREEILFHFNTLVLELSNILIPEILTASTHDQDVFGFYSDERFCNGFEEVLSRYREIVPHLKLAGVGSI